PIPCATAAEAQQAATRAAPVANARLGNRPMNPSFESFLKCIARSGGARADLDDELLAELFRQELGNQARDEVRRAARRLANDDFNWPHRIGLRPSDTRYRWQRSSARGQMQEFATGKFHFDPSLSGLSIRSPRRRGREGLAAR